MQEKKEIIDLLNRAAVLAAVLDPCLFFKLVRMIWELEGRPLKLAG